MLGKHSFVSNVMAVLLGHRYWQDHYFEAISSIEQVATKYNLTMTEIALRWISHHSFMKREFGDSVLIGASSMKHIQEVRHSA